ncbi:ABC transporter substrate-binding protein [Patulibacter defluvii]|uniref:ABC transporter substrate-binding protein n=1 Tax=Patulibacter defluvii TaxID=3095358 RepID=UPI002A74C6C7|nr:hypothetical protein [Patulibacter sp. DM4]
MRGRGSARRSPRRLAAGLALIAAAGGLAGCGDDPGGEQAFDTKIALYVNVPLRGPWGPQGQAIMNGARLAIDDSGGGVGSYSLRLTIRDVTNDDGVVVGAQGAAREAGTALRDQGAIAMVGGLDPVSVRQLELLAGQTGLSFVAASGDEVEDSVADQSPRGRRLYVRLAASDRAIVAQLARRARAADCRRSVLLAVGAGGQRTDALRAALPSRVRLVTGDRFARAADVREVDPALVTATRRALGADPGCVVVASEPSAGDPALLLRPLARELRGATLLLTRGAASQAVAELARRSRIAAEAIVDDPAPATDAETRRIAERWRQVYGTPLPVGAIAGWRSVKLVLRAVKAAGARGNWRRDVADALPRVAVPGPPAEGRQQPDGSVVPAPVGLARPTADGWTVAENLSGG